MSAVEGQVQGRDNVPLSPPHKLPSSFYSMPWFNCSIANSSPSSNPTRQFHTVVRFYSIKDKGQ
eukprot:5132182-Amphidinium_carterae.1